MRTKAIQNLYAFYINQQASYQYALEEIKLSFIPDVFASISPSQEQLTEEREQAISLFRSWASGKGSVTSSSLNYSAAANLAAKKAWDSYQLSLAQNSNLLEKSWNEALDKIRNAYLLSIQLLIEWFSLAQKQAQRNKELPQASITYPIGLTHSHLLEKLKSDPTFLQLTQLYKISWDENMHLVARWYNQFIKDNIALAGPSTTQEQETQIISQLLKDVIFGQDDIQQFFSDLDLSWEENKPIVKRLLYQVPSLEIQDCIEKIQQTVKIETNSAEFYNKLIHTFLEQEQTIDTLVQQHIQNWSIERTVPLDRIIIKLAICEMRYFSSIPINVAINEYVDLAKRYSTDKSSQFVNGVLDTIAKMI